MCPVPDPHCLAAPCYSPSPLASQVMYKQALAIGKLVCPNQDQSGVAEGLADAQFGQGKIHEAQKTLKHNGLLKGSANDGLPTSFLRFINSRGDGEPLDDE